MNLSKLPFLLAVGLAVPGWTQSVTFARGDSAKVKAQMVGRYFTVEGKVNGKPAKFIVDSGAGLNVLTPEAADKFGIKGGMAVAAQGAGSERKQAKLVKVEDFEVGGAAVHDESAVVIDLPGALQCDGLVGYSFLHHFVVTLNYGEASLTFTDPNSFKGPAGAVKTEMKVVSNIPRVPGAVDGIDGWFQLDTGANGGMSIMAAFVEANHLKDKYGNSEPRIVGKGVGGFTRGQRARLEKVAIGGTTFADVPVVLSSQKEGALAAGDLIANVGAEILNRFTVTLDYAGKAAYFEKNSTVERPFDVDRSGMWLDMQGKKYVVVDVAPGSPAAEAGLKVDDEVLSIDGKSMAGVHPLEASRPLQGKAGTKLKISFRRNGETKDVEVTLRDL